MADDRRTRLEERLRSGRFERPGGPFEFPGPPSKIAAQLLFLDAVSDVEPMVLVTLGEEPLAELATVADLIFAPNVVVWRVRHEVSYARELLEGDPRLAPLRDRLVAWGQRWGLRDAWCREHAFWTLHEWWARPDDDPGHRRWDPSLGMGQPGDPPLDPEETRVAFEHPGWSFPWESRGEVRARVLAAFKRHLDARLKETEALFREVGLEPPPEKRKSTGYAWLAQYQVRKMGFTDIARMANVDRQTVYDEVHGLAEIMGLTLRSPDPRGRPPTHATPRTRRKPSAPRSAIVRSRS